MNKFKLRRNILGLKKGLKQGCWIAILIAICLPTLMICFLFEWWYAMLGLFLGLYIVCKD
jgi:hypothetical protein